MINRSKIERFLKWIAMGLARWLWWFIRHVVPGLIWFLLKLLFRAVVVIVSISPLLMFCFLVSTAFDGSISVETFDARMKLVVAGILGAVIWELIRKVVLSLFRLPKIGVA